MSQLEGAFLFDLNRGFGWFAVVRFDANPDCRRKVIYQAGRVFGGPQITIYLDDDNRICFETIDAGGRATLAGPLPKEMTLLQPAMLLYCGIERSGRTNSRLFVMINGKEVAHALAKTNWRPPARLPASIGADLLGGDESSLALLELGVLAETPNKRDLRKLRIYVADKYDI